MCLLFVSLFFMVYTPPKYFILWDLKSVLYLIAWGWKKFKFLGGLLYCSSCTFLARGGGVRSISSIEPSKTNHVISRTVEGSIICFMCVCSFFSVLLGNFLFGYETTSYKQPQIEIYSKICHRGSCMSLGVHVYSK